MHLLIGAERGRRSVFRATLVTGIVMTMALAACGGGGASLVGRWEFAFPGSGTVPSIPATLEVNADGSWSMSLSEVPDASTGSWEQDGDVYELRAINLHTGELQESGFLVRRLDDGRFVMTFEGAVGEIPLREA